MYKMWGEKKTAGHSRFFF